MADLERIRALQGRIRQMERTRVDSPAITTVPGLADVLPGGGLKQGAAYSVIDSLSLVTALLSGPSSAGVWCGVIGIPDFGVEAAAANGVDLGRLVLVPRPGKNWLHITAALADAVGVVVTRPLERVSPGDSARLASRLRQCGATLIALGEWPRAEARLSVAGSVWSGVGRGHGYPTTREVLVAVADRTGRPRTVRLMLPETAGGIQPESRQPRDDRQPRDERQPRDDRWPRDDRLPRDGSLPRDGGWSSDDQRLLGAQHVTAVG